MSTFTLSTTQKNKPLLLSKGFSYTIDKTTNDKTYWKCEDARKLKCKGRVHTNNINTILIHENDSHNHNGSAVSTEIRLFEEKVRDQHGNIIVIQKDYSDPIGFYIYQINRHRIKSIQLRAQ